MESKEPDRNRQLPVKAAMIFAVFVMVFGLFHIYRTVTQYDRAEKEYTEIRQKAVAQKEEEETEPADIEPGIEVDIKQLQKENPDTAGWIYYPALQINYPVMQDDDNAYYIKRTFEGKKNAAGSIFLDCNAKQDFQDMHTIVYGHNMRDGSMFGDLKEIREKDVVKENPYFWIFTEDGVHTYEIFSYHDAEVKDKSFHTSFENEEAYEDFLEHIQKSAEAETSIEMKSSDRVVTLSTCTSDSSVRFLVHGKQIQ